MFTFINYSKKIKKDGLSVRNLEDLINKVDVKKKVPGNFTKVRKYNNIELIMKYNSFIQTQNPFILK